jgi:RES domain-containing protein
LKAPTAGAWPDLLRVAPTRPMRRRLARCVPQLHFMGGSPPRYFFISGRPNRCNPAGVECLYFSGSQETADLEYRRQWRATPAEHQPKLTFFARVALRRVVDLGSRMTLRALGISAADLLADWRMAPSPTRLQELGRAIDRQKSIAAVRLPSAAARESRRKGWNVAIYPAALSPPDRVEILGDSNAALEVLP